MIASDTAIFHVQTRKNLGKSVKQLRKKGFTPINLYGMNLPSQSLSLNTKELEQQLKESESGLVYLHPEDENKKTPALIDEVVRHPIKGDLLHVSFKRVSLKEKVVTEVPVVLEGESEVSDATVLQLVDFLEVECLPTEIPESIVVQLETLTEVGQVVTIQDLISQTKLQIVCEEDQLENPVVLLQGASEEVEEEESEPIETEIIGKGKSEESAEADEKKAEESESESES